MPRKTYSFVASSDLMGNLEQFKASLTLMDKIKRSTSDLIECAIEEYIENHAKDIDFSRILKKDS